VKVTKDVTRFTTLDMKLVVEPEAGATVLAPDYKPSFETPPLALIELDENG